MAVVFLLQSLIKHITPIRNFRALPFAAPSNLSIGNRSSFSTQISPEESTIEILNQILAADDKPSISRENICIDYIRKLCAEGNLVAASSIPENLRGKRIFLGPRAYNYILEAADEKNNIEVLSRVFKDLLLSCGSIRLNSYLIIARAIRKHSYDSVVLLNFIEEVCESELLRIDIVLNRLIFALAKCGYIENALLIVGHIRSVKCNPDLVIYNTVLAILGRLGRVDDMVRVFEFMKTGDLVPDIFTYNTVLNSLRKMGRLESCLLYFKEMSERGIQPDLMTYKALVESLGRSGNIGEALKIFDEMKRKKMPPSVHIYRALIFSLKKMGKMELALKFDTEMKRLCPKAVVPRDFQCKSR